MNRGGNQRWEREGEPDLTLPSINLKTKKLLPTVAGSPEEEEPLYNEVPSTWEGQAEATGMASGRKLGIALAPSSRVWVIGCGAGRQDTWTEAPGQTASPVVSRSQEVSGMVGGKAEAAAHQEAHCWWSTLLRGATWPPS